jgi:hypothetical protein
MIPIIVTIQLFPQLTPPSRYCNHVHLSEEQDQEDTIYLTLLSLYLTPPHNHEVQNGPALAILAKHGSRLPADAALSLIPAELEVRELEFYFKGRMRAANSVFNEARIVAQLRKTRDMQIQAQLALGDGVRGGGTRARHVTVTEERICGVCHKRLGGSVINVFPEYVPFLSSLQQRALPCSPVLTNLPSQQHRRAPRLCESSFQRSGVGGLRDLVDLVPSLLFDTQ